MWHSLAKSFQTTNGIRYNIDHIFFRGEEPQQKFLQRAVSSIIKIRSVGADRSSDIGVFKVAAKVVVAITSSCKIAA